MQITPDFVRDPYPTYARMRAEAPVHLSDANTGRTWFVPRYDDVGALLRDPRLSAAAKAGGFAAQFPPEARAEFAEWNTVIARWIVLLDPPVHRQVRQLMNQGFTRRLIATMRPKITAICAALLDEVEKEPEFDFMAGFAQPFPAQVIAEMLGVDPADHESFLDWSDAIVSFAGSLRPTLEMFRRAQDGLLAMVDYFAAVLPERRAHPGEDLISLLAGAEEEGQRLSAEDVLANCAQLIFAGHETTRNLVGNGLVLLLRNPAAAEGPPRPGLPGGSVRPWFGGGPVPPGLVREMLRYESPLQFIRRVAVADFAIGEAEIRAGDGMVLMLGSANRDERRFPAADTFDPDRPPGQVAFGYGAHVCIGAALAETEAEIALGQVLARFPGLRLLDPDPPRVMNPMLRGYETLRVATGA